MTILHLSVICVTYLLLQQGFVHATVEIIDSFGRKVDDFPNRYATFINATMEGYIESAVPSDSCTPIDPPTFSANFTMKKMVLINGTSTCDFMTKVQNAKSAGYDIAVLFDPSPEPFEYPNITFPLVDVNLSVVLLLFEDAIVIRRNFLYNISDKENFIISISSNVENLPEWQIILILTGVFLAAYYGLVCLWKTCCACIQLCTQSYTRLSGNEDHSDHVDPERVEEFSPFADYVQRGTKAQRRNALRNLQRRYPSKEYSEDHKFDIDTCAICFEKFKKGEKTRELSCNHEYHVGCIDNHLVHKSRQDTCPLCKSEVNMANSLVNSTESTRLLTSNYNLYSSSTSANGHEPSEVASDTHNPTHSTDESGKILATPEGSINYVENESDDVQLV